MYSNLNGKHLTPSDTIPRVYQQSRRLTTIPDPILQKFETLSVGVNVCTYVFTCKCIRYLHIFYFFVFKVFVGYTLRETIKDEVS